jgi:MFS family permease
MKNEKVSQDKTDSDLRPLYARSVVNSFGAGMVNPFIGAYAVKLGASDSDMGWFQSASNISNNIMQVFWGRLSDQLKRRNHFIILGTIIMSTLWIPMILVTNATQLILLITIQALIGSMATPAWIALIGDMVPSAKLGRANASITLWASIGSVIATIASGTLMLSVGGTPQEMMLIPLLSAAAFGIISCIAMVSIKEQKNGEKLNLRKQLTSNFVDTLAIARKNPDFVRYCYVVGVFEFSMSICWPLLPITQVEVLNATMLHIALLSVVQVIITIIFQGWAGRVTDTMGRRPALTFFRLALVTVPLAYAFAPDINTLIVVGAFWGFVNALGNAAVTAYLLDIAPEEHRGSFTAVFNLMIGVTTFFGSLIGGYLSAYTTSVFGLIVGLQIVYMISMSGRIAGGLLHFRLKETLKKS